MGIHMLPRLLSRVLLVSLLLIPPAYGQPPAASASAPAQSVNPDPLGRDTPKGTVLGFMQAASDGNLERAAQYLAGTQKSSELADRTQHLLAVLNAGLLTRELEALSTTPEGNLNDDLQPNMERVGTVKKGSATLDIELERVQQRGDLPTWRFSKTTLDGVGAIYREIQPRWIERTLWPPLVQIRYLNVPLWVWIGTPLTLLLIFGVSRLMTRGLTLISRWLVFRLTGERYAYEMAQLTGPIRVVAVSLATLLWLGLGYLPLLARLTANRIAVALGIVGLAWLLMRVSDIATQLVVARLRRLHQPGGVTIAQLVGSLGKLLTILVAALWLLFLADVDLTTALAGLGIGGIAIAFAAQKTLENLFGGIMIISDQPVRAGDFCKVGAVLGTIESIGLRSTRIRTVDRTVVSVPNAQMASESLENFGFRDKIIFRPTLGLRFETGADQLRFVLAEIRRMLYEHPMVESESARVRFVRFGNSSLDLEIFAYVLVDELPRFLEVQEDLLLRIMDIVETGGTGFAFPSSTTYFARDTGLDENRTNEANAVVKRWRESQELPFPNFHPAKIAAFDGKLEYPPPGSEVPRPP
jgi:MscS family membrane protein